jgi:hypothetical protein
MVCIAGGQCHPILQGHCRRQDVHFPYQAPRAPQVGPNLRSPIEDRPGERQNLVLGTELAEAYQLLICADCPIAAFNLVTSEFAEGESAVLGEVGFCPPDNGRRLALQQR